MSNCSAATLPSFVALSNIDRTSTGPFGGSLNGGNTTQVCGFNPYFLPSWSNLTSCCSTPVYNITSSSDNSTISSSCGLSCIAFCGYEEPRTTHLGFSDCLFGGGEIPNNWQAQCFTVNSPGDTTGSCGTNASTTIVMPIVSPTPTPVSSTALSNTSTMSTAASSQQSASWLSTIVVSATANTSISETATHLHLPSGISVPIVNATTTRLTSEIPTWVPTTTGNSSTFNSTTRLPTPITTPLTTPKANSSTTDTATAMPDSILVADPNTSEYWGTWRPATTWQTTSSKSTATPTPTRGIPSQKDTSGAPKKSIVWGMGALVLINACFAVLG